MKLKIRNIRDRARGHWIEILQDLAPSLGRYSGTRVGPSGDRKALERIGMHVACPVHGGKDGFRLFRDVAESGGGICNTCGPKASGFELLRWLNGWTLQQTVEAVAANLRMEATVMRPAQRAAAKSIQVRVERTNSKSRDTLRRIWNECVTINHPLAEVARRYLRKRGLSAKQFADINTVRFHPQLAYWNEDGKLIAKFPAIVCLVSDVAGCSVTLYRIYLSPDGRKAAVESPKKMMPLPEGESVVGGCVRLGSPVHVIGIAEGLETALAVNRATGMTVWAAMSATLLEKWEPPSGVESVYIWADLDVPDRANGARRGEEAANTLKCRLLKKGIRVQLLVPAFSVLGRKKGVDWNDVLLNQGCYGFPHSTILKSVA